MVKRGVLHVPVVGVAFPPWSLEQVRDRRKGQRRAIRGRRRPRRLERLLSLLRYVSGDYNDPNTFTVEARRWPTPAARHTTWPSRPKLFETVIRGLATRAGRGRAGHRREALRPRPCLGAGTQPRRPVRLSRGLDLPHRPLPRERSDHEHPLFPLRQLVPGADLEPELRGRRADHAGRGFRRRGPRRVSTRLRAACGT